MSICLRCNQEYQSYEEPVGPCENCQFDMFVEEFFENINSTSSRLFPPLSGEPPLTQKSSKGINND